MRAASLTVVVKVTFRCCVDLPSRRSTRHLDSSRQITKLCVRYQGPVAKRLLPRSHQVNDFTTEARPS